MIKAVRVSLLVLLLASSTYAGWIQNDVYAPPPPPPSSSASTEGWIQNDDIESGTALALLQSVLAIF